jgi:hypothetical protein
LRSLRKEVAGYHTNHNRVPTLLASKQRIGNSLLDCYYNVDEAVPEGQQDSWGLAGVELEEIRVEPDRLRQLMATIAIDPNREFGSPQDITTRDNWCRINYDIRHVLPFVMDAALSRASSHAIGYVGVSSQMERALEAVMANLDGSVSSVTEGTAASLDIVILDLGLGLCPGGDQAAERRELAGLLDRVQDAVNILRVHAPAARIVAINGESGIWAPWVLGNFNASPSSLHSRVQRLALKGESDCSDDDVQQLRCALAWVARDPDAPLTGIVEDWGVDYLESSVLDGFGSGWDMLTPWGVNMAEADAHVCLEVPDWSEATGVIGVRIRRIDYGPNADDQMFLDVYLGGEVITTRELVLRSEPIDIAVEVPQSMMGQEVPVRFSIRRTGDSVYTPRLLSDWYNTPATWVRLERLVMHQLQPTGGKHRIDMEFDDDAQVKRYIVDGWSGVHAGLVFGRESGRFWAEIPEFARRFLVVEAGRVSGRQHAIDAVLTVTMRGEEVGTMVLSGSRYWQLAGLELPVDTESMELITLDLAAASDGHGDFNPADWRLRSSRIIGRPETEMPRNRTVVVDSWIGPGVEVAGGWCPYEVGYMWQTSLAADLLLRMPCLEPGDRLHIVVDTVPLENAPQSARFLIDGAVVVNARLLRGRNEIVVPLEGHAAGDIICLRIEVPHLVSPAVESSKSKDERLLGLCLRAIQIGDRGLVLPPSSHVLDRREHLRQIASHVPGARKAASVARRRLGR